MKRYRYLLEVIWQIETNYTACALKTIRTFCLFWQLQFIFLPLDRFCTHHCHTHKRKTPLSHKVINNALKLLWAADLIIRVILCTFAIFVQRVNDGGTQGGSTRVNKRVLEDDECFCRKGTCKEWEWQWDTDTERNNSPTRLRQLGSPRRPQ